ncbi:helix-turn-helix domain-containing protein [Flavisolibacter ginsengisoli]|jgi:AraC-like DNA-binding protein|uniref:Helix-turn-helix domain-containing protein n=1 Tax=Flavisolibacter ginsengisoli DSM 18119 TaxID=1121884 RepID=A0A1M5BSY1_9BACT|nr:helix-turn-helix domain-containing protein [Flavisolibacter ginsengisoli]SHF45639.1 Helix-turn-helix domain-containing protein [Flavisolibacter ginsengisoli DSM 18119]
MQIQFQHIEPHFLLKNYIEKMWLFKTSGRMPMEDLKLVVPNGNLKLTISYKNGIVASMKGKTFSSKEHDITLTGLVDVPVILDTEKDVETETIGIEFRPQGVYRFFHFNLNEIKNQIYSLDDLLGNRGKQLTEQIANAASAKQKMFLVQQFLIDQLYRKDEDLIFEYCVEKINSSKGKITIKELEKKTGYSTRWLNIKFKEKLGVSPKNLSSVIRFKHYYQAIVNGKEKSFLKNDFYELYYDQSHFIKDFKRFTGSVPTKFEKQINSFGESYYKA